MIPDDMLPPSDDSDNDEIADMVVNANRPRVVYEDTDSSSEDDDDGDINSDKNEDTWNDDSFENGKAAYKGITANRPQVMYEDTDSSSLEDDDDNTSYKNDDT